MGAYRRKGRTTQRMGEEGAGGKKGCG